MTCIIAYDIENNKQRTKLSRFLASNGVRIQKSVFAVELERYAYKGFLKKLEKITGKKGNIAIFRLCKGCTKKAVTNEKEKIKYYIF